MHFDRRLLSAAAAQSIANKLPVTYGGREGSSRSEPDERLLAEVSEARVIDHVGVQTSGKVNGEKYTRRWCNAMVKKRIAFSIKINDSTSVDPNSVDAEDVLSWQRRV